MNRNEIPCPLCGTVYSDSEGQLSCPTCPIHHGCRMLRCPSCGYEVPAPTRLTRWLSRWIGRKYSERRSAAPGPES